MIAPKCGIRTAGRVQSPHVIAHRRQQVEASAALDSKPAREESVPRVEAPVAQQNAEVVSTDAGGQLAEDAEQASPGIAKPLRGK